MRRRVRGASMGPRPFGRGRPASGRRRGLRLPGFNGAATFRPRKAEHRLVRAERRRASMGPRPFGRGRKYPDNTWAGTCQLQWGRDLSAAEGQAQQPFSPGHLVASMGPRPFGRGRTAGNAVSQRAARSFNGAATFRPRKGGGGGNHSSAAKPLQWGRDLSAAEGLCAAAFECGRPASMGPRPFGRGRRRAHLGDGGGSAASMGPRPFGRGRRPAPRVSCAWRRASMGPRPFGRGRPMADRSG